MMSLAKQRNLLARPPGPEYDSGQSPYDWYWCSRGLHMTALHALVTEHARGTGLRALPVAALLLLVLATPVFTQPLPKPPAWHPAGSGTTIPDFDGGLRLPGMQTDAAPAGIQSGDGTWSVPFHHPASRKLHCAVYDPVRRRMIVFGGYRPLDLIWTLALDDRPQWASFPVSGPFPSDRYGATAIYDPVRDRVLMFGGTSAYPAYVATNEVWSLSLSGIPTWTRLEISGSAPSARSLHTAIYDAASDRMIIYGGGSWSSRLGDVWALDLSGDRGWREITTQTPAPPATRTH